VKPRLTLAEWLKRVRDLEAIMQLPHMPPDMLAGKYAKGLPPTVRVDSWDMQLWEPNKESAK
jgi:hypothetical protein